MRKIGRYEVRRELCRGTTPLLEAVDPTLGRPVMIRALSHALALDADRRSRFLDASMLAARLTSPRIASVLDLGDDHGDPFVVMKLPEGPSLREIMDEPDPRPEAFCVDVISQLCEALAHAHRRGLFQVGLRPTGIFVSDEGRVTVVPFGTVPIHGSGGTLAALSLEDVAYLAPELVDSRVPDRRADIFTVGVIAYELLARRRPFEGASIPALLNALVNGRPDATALERTSRSSALERVILKALAQDPAERYAEAGLMLVDLEALICEGPLGADPPVGRTQPVEGAAPAGPPQSEVEMLRAQALSCAAEGRFEDAQELLLAAEEREPGDPRNALLRDYLQDEAATEALLEVAREQVERGNLRAARTAAGEALALDPARPQARALVRQLDRILFVERDKRAVQCPPESPRT